MTRSLALISLSVSPHRIQIYKANRRITKASSSKASATKTSAPTADDACLLVLGFDEQQKPCGARFVGAKPDLVAKAAQLMGLEVSIGVGMGPPIGVQKGPL